MTRNHWTSNFKRASKEDRTDIDGVTHDSVNEMKRWYRLKLMQREGYITELERQVPLPLILPDGTPIRTREGISKATGKPIGGKPIVYKLDFRYKIKGGEVVYEEFKGHMDEEAALKLSVVEAIYKIKIIIVRKP